MELVVSVFPYVGAFCLIILANAFTCYSCLILRKRNESDIRVIWYFYGLTVVVSFLIGVWSINAKAINSTGNFEGEHGTLIHAILASALDVNLSFYILVSAFTLIVGPQVISYILSGIFGVARAPKFINESVSFLVWGGVKTFIVVSGISTIIPLFGLFFSWESFTASKALAWFLLSFVFCSFSFLVILIYRESEEVVVDVRRYLPKSLLRVAELIHQRSTKYSNLRKR